MINFRIQNEHCHAITPYLPLVWFALWSYTFLIIFFIESIIFHLDNTNSLYDIKERDGSYVQKK